MWNICPQQKTITMEELIIICLVDANQCCIMQNYTFSNKIIWS